MSTVPINFELVLFLNPKIWVLRCIFRKVKTSLKSDPKCVLRATTNLEPACMMRRIINLEPACMMRRITNLEPACMMRRISLNQHE